MSRTWYPVINYESCKECGACFNKCKHGVFKLDGRRPAVVKIEGCVQGCHGCGNLCPEGAIEYIGDITGWIAPAKHGSSKDTTCTGCCNILK